MSKFVADIRKALAEVRRSAKNKPMFITDPVGDGKLSIQEFCLDFLKSHSEKRHSKNIKTSLN